MISLLMNIFSKNKISQYGKVDKSVISVMEDFFEKWESSRLDKPNEFKIVTVTF